jgi:hypothetical protein
MPLQETEMSRPAGPGAGPAYGWMALAALVVIVAGKLLLPFPNQQRAQNISLAIEAVAGAALGLVLKSRHSG